MNVFGMGTLEVLAILLVAFIVLGPRRMADAARLLGKATREVRRITEGLPDLVLDEEPEEPGENPVARGGASRARSGTDGPAGPAEAAESKGRDSEDDVPVAFQSSGSHGNRDEPGLERKRKNS